MKKLHIIIGALLFTTAANAQMKIKDPLITSGTTAPDPNAILELQSNNKGLLMSRVQLTATNSYLPLTGTPVAGMTVYNIGPAGSGPTAVTAGYYYNDGTNWIKLGAATAGWTTTGNAGTTPTTNFMGTTDDEDVIFKRNNILSGTLNSSANNTSWGVNALVSNTSGTDNAAVGTNALYSSITGSSNTALGANTLYFYYNSVPYNINSTAIGEEVLYYSASPNNTAIGYQALQFTFAAAGGDVAVGQMAGWGDYEGVGITMIGSRADVTNNTLTDVTAFGARANVGTSFTMQFGNPQAVGWGFGSGVPTSTNVFVVGSNSTNGNGAYLTAGGVWTNVSDRNLKEDITTPDGKGIVAQIETLEIPKWKYKGTKEYHVGPMAQDFYKAFRLGNDDKHVSTVDPAGIALNGVKELITENDSLEVAIAKQREVNNDLQAQLNDLKTLVAQLQRGNNNQNSGASLKQL